MITYTKHILNNGLTVLANRDCTSQLAAVNLLYKVGARNEKPSCTGLGGKIVAFKKILRSVRVADSLTLT